MKVFGMQGEKSFPLHFLFFGSFSLILFFSVSPSVYVGDSSLFTATSFFLGSSHPPAYPLFNLLGKFFTFLPFGNVAFKVNILPAFFCALTVLLSYQASFYSTKKSIVSLFAPLLVLTSSNFLFESSKAEVYTLNAFFVMLIFYLCLRALKEEFFFKEILLSSFILGLGMANHHTSGFMLFLIIYVLFIRRKVLPPGTLVFSILLFLAGLSVYFYLLGRSFAGTFINYSPVYSFYDFLQVFSRHEYSGGTLAAAKGAVTYGIGWFYAIKNYAIILSREIHPVMWLFIFAGLFASFRDRKKIICLVVSVATWILLARMTLSVKELSIKDLTIVSQYFLQVIPILGVIGSIGLFAFHEKIKGHSTLISRVLVTGIILFQIIYISISVQKASLSDNYIASGWLKNIASIFKPKSFYLAFGDNPAFLSYYGFGVERLRDDVLVMDGYTGHNTFRLILAPKIKYYVWYPDFYDAEMTSVKYFYPIAEEGRLYASRIGSLPPRIRDKFDTRRYVLGSILMSRDSNLLFEEKFKHDFQKIDYRHILLGYKEDFLMSDLLVDYYYSIWAYAQLLADENLKEAEHYYRLSLYLANRDLKFEIFKDYLGFVAKKSPTAASELITELVKTAPDAESKKKIEEIKTWFESEYAH